MKQLIRKQYFLYWIAIPILLKIFSIRRNQAIEINFLGKWGIIGYIDIGVIMSAILALVSFCFLILDFKKIKLNIKSFLWTCLNILTSLLIANYIIINGFFATPYLFTQENGDTKNNGFVEMINFMSIALIIIWIFIEIITLYWVYKQVKSSQN